MIELVIAVLLAKIVEAAEANDHFAVDNYSKAVQRLRSVV